ncbi:hypothetical protein SLEP1_g12287 [Rubroshorea leprosula]|uniref:Uncharacterized protein n=1 Tax=Rubroshorea leprosula TaxID=152421 RepID=A0AAV5ILU5_9ROSI|nr:hypothetical protein SLEP1_g12287 [Rubroshorea leprosula]
MSSKETLSVRGSEEVKVLKYGDGGIESGLSGSDRAEDEVGVREVVEGEGEEIPSNILEIEGGDDRCYDVEADIVFEVKGYESELVTRDSLSYLVETYDLPHQVLIRPAGVKERACSAPRDHWMPMYAHYLVVGLRFPIPELLVWLLLEYNVGLTQFVPNAIRAIIGFMVYCRARGVKWERKDGEVEFLCSWKAKKTNQNKYSLNSDEEEEVEKLVREKGEILDISSDVINAAELYGPSSLSEAEMDKFLSSVEGIAIPKKPRKKSKTYETIASGRGNGNNEKEHISKEEIRGDEVMEFVPRPPLVELDPELKETGVTTHGKVDRRRAREEALIHEGISVVKHALETTTWVNALAKEFMELVKEHNSLQQQKDELQKKNGEMQRELDMAIPTVTSLQNERDLLKTILSFNEKKRKMCEEKIEAQEEEIKRMKESEAKLKKKVKLLVNNGIEEHIANFLNSSSFDNIVNLYRLPIAILAFIDCRKKESQPLPQVEIHPVPLEEEQPTLPEVEQPPFPVVQQPPHLAEQQPPPLAE